MSTDKVLTAKEMKTLAWGESLASSTFNRDKHNPEKILRRLTNSSQSCMVSHVASILETSQTEDIRKAGIKLLELHLKNGGSVSVGGGGDSVKVKFNCSEVFTNLVGSLRQQPVPSEKFYTNLSSFGCFFEMLSTAQVKEIKPLLFSGIKCPEDIVISEEFEANLLQKFEEAIKANETRPIETITFTDDPTNTSNFAARKTVFQGSDAQLGEMDTDSIRALIEVTRSPAFIALLKRKDHWGPSYRFLDSFFALMGVICPGKKFCDASPFEQAQVKIELFVRGNPTSVSDFCQAKNFLDFDKKGRSLETLPAFMDSRSDPEKNGKKQIAQIMETAGGRVSPNMATLVIVGNDDWDLKATHIATRTEIFFNNMDTKFATLDFDANFLGKKVMRDVNRQMVPCGDNTAENITFHEPGQYEVVVTIYRAAEGTTQNHDAIATLFITLNGELTEHSLKCIVGRHTDIVRVFSIRITVPKQELQQMSMKTAEAIPQKVSLFEKMCGTPSAQIASLGDMEPVLKWSPSPRPTLTLDVSGRESAFAALLSISSSVKKAGGGGGGLMARCAPIPIDELCGDVSLVVGDAKFGYCTVFSGMKDGVSKSPFSAVQFNSLSQQPLHPDSEPDTSAPFQISQFCADRNLHVVGIFDISAKYWFFALEGLQPPVSVRSSLTSGMYPHSLTEQFYQYREMWCACNTQPPIHSATSVFGTFIRKGTTVKITVGGVSRNLSV
jgi:hypothetical protein